MGNCSNEHRGTSFSASAASLSNPLICSSINTFFFLDKYIFSQVIQDQLNKKVLDSLAEFIKKHGLGCSSDNWRQRAREIPTAALMLGVNVPDHAMTFRSLCNLLQDSVTPFVVSVHAKECAGVYFLVQDCYQGRRRQEDINYITFFYNANNVVCLKLKSGSNHGLKILNLSFFIFYLINSRYTQELPFIFIFGIATSPSAIQHRLPHSVSSLLCIEVFHSLSCTQHLASVFDKLILNSQFPFKLSSRVIQVLVGIFLYHDFSVQNFVKGLQFSMLEHFKSQPLSMLCCQKQEALLSAKTLSKKNVERIRHLPSFMRYVETQEPQEQVQLLTNDEHVKEVCQQLLKNLHKYHKNYYPILQCLHSLTSSLPKFPLGKHIRELHVSCIEKNLWETEEYDSALQLLRILAKDELVAALRKCAEILKSTKILQNVLQQLEDFIGRLEALEGKSETVCVPRKMEYQKTDLFQLQKTLLEKESRRTKRMNPYEVLRSQVIEFIDSLVREYLTPAELQPLNEVCYYSSSGVLRQRLNVTPRTSIQAALSHPFYYLQNESLKTDAGTISSAAPDLCIVYKLHLECGRLINLYDWLEAFVTVMSAAEDQDTNSEDARFIQAVSEMEFLGFIKSTKQKTDHVARLTWGGC
uniref:Origin recognition complex subunit 3 n=1 Tax=Cyprinus carpio TaxID=7962 RepID=A0A8C2GWZ2_CYPCA